MNNTATRDRKDTGCRPQACKDCRMHAEAGCMTESCVAHTHGTETAKLWLKNAGTGNLCSYFDRIGTTCVNCGSKLAHENNQPTYCIDCAGKDADLCHTDSRAAIRTEYVEVQRPSDGAILHTATIRSDWSRWTMQEFKKDYANSLLLTKNGPLPIADYYDFEQLTLPEPGSIQAAADVVAGQQAPDPLVIIEEAAADIAKSIHGAHGQESFDPDDYESIAITKLARNAFAKALQARGYKTIRWTLPGQQRGYSGIGTDRDTSTRTIYMIDYVKIN